MSIHLHTFYNLLISSQVGAHTLITVIAIIIIIARVTTTINTNIPGSTDFERAQATTIAEVVMRLCYFEDIFRLDVRSEVCSRQPFRGAHKEDRIIFKTVIAMFFLNRLLNTVSASKIMIPKAEIKRIVNLSWTGSTKRWDLRNLHHISNLFMIFD